MLWPLRAAYVATIHLSRHTRSSLAHQRCSYRRQQFSHHHIILASASADATAELLTFAPSLLQFACLTAFAQNYVLSVMQCVGPSMLPTLGLSGDVVLMWPTASGLITPQLGDVVICSSPTDPTSTVCKRVVGLPGDVVKYKRLPGMPELRETRPAHSRDGSRKSRECIQQVPRGQVWLQGDNSADSCDSRALAAPARAADCSPVPTTPMSRFGT